MRKKHFSEIALAYDIITYLQQNKNDVDVKYLNAIINSSLIDSKKKAELEKYLAELVDNGDVDSCIDNIDLFADLILEHLD